MGLYCKEQEVEWILDVWNPWGFGGQVDMLAGCLEGSLDLAYLDGEACPWYTCLGCHSGPGERDREHSWHGASVPHPLDPEAVIHAPNLKTTSDSYLKSLSDSEETNQKARPDHKPNISCGMCLLLTVEASQGQICWQARQEAPLVVPHGSEWPLRWSLLFLLFPVICLPLSDLQTLSPLSPTPSL